MKTSSSIVRFVVATANTCLGRASREVDGLNSLESADILLLQEVVNPKRDELEQRLAEAGFTLVHAVGKFGLAIALRSKSDIKFVKNSIREHKLQKLAIAERELLWLSTKQPHELKERGVIAAKLITRDGFQFTVATTHPSVNAKSKRRAREIKEIGKEFSNPYYRGPLIVGADMNHYPGPKTIDFKMWAEAGLSLVDLANEPTWKISGTKYEKYARAANLFTGKTLESYDGQLDTMLYRAKDLQVLSAKILDIPSDHGAIVAKFTIKNHSS